ncbi:MAG: hypothetical protein GMKNLPBB_02840 [Myxococcota bacterium]|nr:hypothetical protein [Myxococcota bacterium]
MNDSGSYSVTGGDPSSAAQPWAALARARFQIAAITLFAGAAGLGVSLLIKPVYEAHAVIQVGVVKDIGAVEDPAALTARLESLPFRLKIWTAHLKRELTPDEREDAERMEWKAKVVDGSSAVRTQMRGPTPQDAVKLAELAASAIRTEHADRFDRAIEFYRSQTQDLKESIQTVRNELEQLRAAAKGTGASTDASNAAILVFKQNELLEKEKLLMQQRKELNESVLKMTAMYSRPTALLDAPDAAIRPIRPRRMLITLGAAAAGLMIAVAAALVRAGARSSPP